MATITIRIEDQARDQLQSLAEGQGVSLSDLVRRALLDQLDDPDREGAQPGRVPESLSLVERRKMALLHRILATLVDGSEDEGNAQDQLRLARSLEHGWVADYNTEFTSIEPELSRRDCGFVLDVLDMFRFLKASVEDSAKDLPEQVARRLIFQGFDHNDPFEGKLGEYAYEQIRRGKWRMLADRFDEGNDLGNSHSPMLSRYKRMLAVFQPIWREKLRDMSRDSFRLSDSELRSVASA